MLISLITPTRKRPDNLKRLFKSIIDTSKDISQIEISLRIDVDDEESLKVIDDFPTLKIKGYIGQRSTCYGDYWNDAWKNATGEIYGMIGDDFVFKTQNWDELIIQTFEKSKDKLLFVFGEDGIQHGNIGTHAFIHKKWTDITGYFAAPYFNVYYHDTWNHDIAKGINRVIYIPSLIIEHMHHSVGKSNYDETYIDMSNKTKDDEHIWNQTQNIRLNLINKFKQIIESENK